MAPSVTNVGPMPDATRCSPVEILAAIERAHRLYFRDADRPELFERMLEDVLALTGCEYGFIGEVLHHADGTPYLKSWALTDIAWDEPTRELYESSLGPDGGLVFGNLDTLFGRVLTSRKVVISNDPAHDPRRGGLPPGHPPLLSFLGIPIHRNDVMIGMVGVANRAGGFDEKDVTDLEPYLAVVAHMIDVIRTDRERSAAQAAEREALAAAARQERLGHIGRLASAVAHDVNGLINVISLQCEMLEMQGDLSPSAVTGVARIQEMCEQAAQMTARLQRLRAPTAEPDQRCAVVSTVTSATGFLRSVAGDGVDLTVEIQSSGGAAFPAAFDDVDIAMSDGELIQVLLNLVANATESLGGSGRIRVTVCPPAIVPGSASGPVLIDVSDDGPGVPEGLGDEIFTAFASTKGEGRGLGLSIVHSIVEAHGGTVTVLPVDRGATFRLSVPVASARPRR